MVVPVVNPTKDLILKLIGEKDRLEIKISEYGNILANNGNVGMHGALVDNHGFPRNDIDIYQVRQARQQIICLQNDYKTLVKEIEKQIHKLHSEAAEEQAQIRSLKAAGMHLEEDNTVVSGNVCIAPELMEVIVKVNMISPGSPAEEAGIRVDDNILEFGTINSTNFQNDLNQISNVVKHMRNQRIPLKIQREGQPIDLILIPKTWNGRGLLGCNIVLPNF